MKDRIVEPGVNEVMKETSKTIDVLRDYIREAG